LIKNRLYKIVIIAFFIAIAVVFNLFLAITQEKEKKPDCTSSGCHEDMIKKKAVHPPAKDDCTTCHTLKLKNHPGDPGKEFDLTDKVPALCNTCHDISGPTKSIHSPVKDGDCMACHNPHGSDKKGLLNTNEKKIICTMCHDVESGNKFIHSPIVKEDCMSCHNPHNSKFVKLLKNEEKDLCLTCHSKSIKTKEGSIPNIKEKTKAKFTHAPVNDGCTGCHTPHSSKIAGLFTEPFNKETYVKGVKSSFALCFTCHNSDLLTVQSTDESTNFRDGKKNLHFLHINSPKARNCIICHDVHGSTNPALIKDKVKFGDWMMNIKFTKQEKGGSCAPGCHKQLSYNWVEPINGLIVAKAGEVEKPAENIPEKIVEKIVEKVQEKKPVATVDTSSTIAGKIVLPPRVDKSVAEDINVRVTNNDKSIDTLIDISKDLAYSIKDLPQGSYTISIDEASLKDLDKRLVSSVINVEVKKDDKKPEVKNLEVVAPAKVVIKPKPKIVPNIAKALPHLKDAKDVTEAPAVKSYLGSTIKYLKKNLKSRVQIVVYTDNFGKQEELMIQSTKTARKIEDYLVNNGISRSRILSTGKGPLSPIASNTSTAGRAKNNRIEIVVIK
jgi:predicted CXXCH cytochrome family protein